MRLGMQWIGVLSFFFFKQQTAYEFVSRDWSSDVYSSDLPPSPNNQVSFATIYHQGKQLTAKAAPEANRPTKKKKRLMKIFRLGVVLLMKGFRPIASLITKSLNEFFFLQFCISAILQFCKLQLPLLMEGQLFIQITMKSSTYLYQSV